MKKKNKILKENGKWKEIKTAITEAAGKRVGEIEKRRNADGFDDQCSEAVRRKNAAR